MAFSFRSVSLSLAFVCALASSPAVAAKPAPVQSASSGEMLDISADESLEWYQDSRLYVARGKARAVKGDMIVEADLLSAHVRDPKEGEVPANKSEFGGDIDLMKAEGNVFIHDSKQQVTGEKAVYDLDQKVIKVTGSNLKYKTDKDVVTAKESLEYFEDKAVAVARGRAIAEHQDSRIEANELTAFFVRGATGQTEMSQVQAKGDVIIVTKDGGVSRGSRGVYDAKRDVAVLMDNVRITRGDVQLAGDKAEVDFASGKSRLLNSGSGRVRALLPSSGLKKEKALP